MKEELTCGKARDRMTRLKRDIAFLDSDEKLHLISEIALRSAAGEFGEENNPFERLQESLTNSFVSFSTPSVCRECGLNEVALHEPQKR